MELLRKLNSAPDVSRIAIGNILQGLGRTGKHTYPFGNPVSIEKTHIDVVRRLPYWVAEKTDGVRVSLICTRTPGTPHCVSYLMDRVGRVYGFPIACAAAYYDGSVFDAELVHRPSKDDFVLYVFDVASLKGDMRIGNRPYSVRKAGLESTFAKLSTTSKDKKAMVLGGQIVSMHPDVTLVAKDMFPLSDCGSLQAAVEKLEHASDGFILTPESEGAPAPGTAWTTYKIKEEHTMDLLWSEGDLWYGEGDTLYPIRTMKLDSNSSGVEMNAITFVPEQYKACTGCIVEVLPRVSPDGKSVHLTFMKLRVDRDTPNNVICVTRTLRSAIDNVCLSDLTK